MSNAMKKDRNEQLFQSSSTPTQNKRARPESSMARDKSKSVQMREKEQSPLNNCSKCHKEAKTYLLDCNHSLCLQCIFSFIISTNFNTMTIDEITVHCPVCQQGSALLGIDDWITGLNTLKDLKDEKNYQIETKATKNLEKKCAKHPDSFITKFCGNCQMWLCDECRKLYHDQYYPDHVLFDKEDIKIFCDEHKDTILDYYCINCQEEICNKCLIKDQKHYLHRYITKIEHNKIEEKNKEINLNYHSYSEFEEYLSRIEKRFFGEIENDFIIKRSKINDLIGQLQELEKDYAAQSEEFEKKMSKIFEVFRLSYFNYFTLDKREKKEITIANSLTNISLCSKKKVDPEILLIEFNKQMEDFKEKNIQSKTNTYDFKMVWDNSEIKKNKQLSAAHNDGVTRIIQLRNGRLVSAGIDGQILLWEDYDSDPMKFGGESTKSSGHKSSVWALFETSKNMIVSGSSDKTAKIWSAVQGQGICISTLRGHKGTVYAIAEMRNGNILTGSEDGVIKVWDWNVNKKKCLQDIENGCGITSLITLVDDFIVTGGNDNSIKLFEPESGECALMLTEHGCTVWCLLSFDDGKTIASGSSDNSIKIWDMISGKCLNTLEGHENSVSVIRHLKCGLLMSGSWDFSIKLWNLSTGFCVSTVSGHKGIIFDAIELENGEIATASKDGSIILWQKA